MAGVQNFNRYVLAEGVCREWCCRYAAPEGVGVRHVVRVRQRLRHGSIFPRYRHARAGWEIRVTCLCAVVRRLFGITFCERAQVGPAISAWPGQVEREQRLRMVPGFLHMFTRRGRGARRVRPIVQGATHVGRVRHTNEDSFLTVCLPGHDDVLMAVADGVGGGPAGEVASYLALRTLLRERMTGLPPGDAGDARALLNRAFRTANALVTSANQQVEAGEHRMGTTLVTALFLDRRGVVGHAGDSRCYRYRRSRLKQLTRDDTWVQDLVDQGALSHDQVAGHPLENTLSNGLGIGSDAWFSFHELDCRPGDRYVLCTDGVSRVLPDEQIAQCLAEAETPAVAVQHTIENALCANGNDNITVCVAFCE